VHQNRKSVDADFAVIPSARATAGIVLLFAGLALVILFVAWVLG
jgi:hypothetical protein